jgi:hypothetical protein
MSLRTTPRHRRYIRECERQVSHRRLSNSIEKPPRVRQHLGRESEAAGKEGPAAGPTTWGESSAGELSNDFYGANATGRTYPRKGIIVTTDCDHSLTSSQALAAPIIEPDEPCSCSST